MHYEHLKWESDTITTLRRELAEARAEKLQKQSVIDNLKSDVIPEICRERDDANAKLSAVTLDNARLRAALKKLTTRTRDILRHDKEIIVHGGWEHDLDVPCEICAAISSTPDALAQEVLGYMVHMGDCNADLSEGDDVYKCTCGLDALLAKLGGQK